MGVISTITILSAAISQYFNPYKVTYNTYYDNPSWSLGDTACSNGEHGLQSRWPTLGNIPGYPRVGGVPGLVWNSPLCGTCWELTYHAPDGSTHRTTIVAVDSGGADFDIAKDAFAPWAGPAGVAAGSVLATATQVSPHHCGIY